MQEEVLELLVQVFFALGYTAVAVVVAGLGISIEYAGLSLANVGDYLLALWVGAIGAVVLLFAYLIVRHRLFPLIVPSGG
ncbi:hypothetical protein [Natronorarus salvus]|uniref:hypothetical protein n=1 Tax=Natronorarus salvus TaxID=3117733 RepID=UPI002F25F90F